MANALHDKIKNDLHDLSRGIEIGHQALDPETAIHITATVLEAFQAHLIDKYPALSGAIEALEKTIDNLPDVDDINKDDEPVEPDPEDKTFIPARGRFSKQITVPTARTEYGKGMKDDLPIYRHPKNPKQLPKEDGSFYMESVHAKVTPPKRSRLLATHTEFQCIECGRKFRRVLRKGTLEVPCPKCNSIDVEVI